MDTTPPGTGTTGTGTAHQPPRAPWRFVRRERGRMIAGVATGMADAFHVDVVVMRVIWVVVAVASFGVGVAAYAICWLAFPSDEHPAPLDELRHRPGRSRRHNAGFIAGLALLGLGLVIVFGQLVQPFRHGGAVVWAAVLIGAGLAVLLLRHPDPDPEQALTPPVTPEASEPTPSAPVPPADRDAVTAPSPTGGGTVPAPPAPPVPPSAWTQSAAWPVAPTPRVRRPRRRPFLTPLTCSILLIGGGIVTLLDNAGTTHITVAEALLAAAGLIGLVLVLSAWFGRAHGLIPLGILLLLAAIPASLIDVPITAGIGERHFAPVSRAQLHRTYSLGIGKMELDLRSAPIEGETTRVAARVGFGELDVDVPSTVRVVVSAHAGAGTLQVFGRTYDNALTTSAKLTAPGTSGGVLYLDARVGAGEVHVRRFDASGIETFPQEVNR